MTSFEGLTRLLAGATVWTEEQAADVLMSGVLRAEPGQPGQNGRDRAGLAGREHFPIPAVAPASADAMLLAEAAEQYAKAHEDQARRNRVLRWRPSETSEHEQIASRLRGLVSQLRAAS